MAHVQVSSLYCACPSLSLPFCFQALDRGLSWENLFYVTSYRYLDSGRHQIQEQPTDGLTSDLPRAGPDRLSPKHGAMPMMQIFPFFPSAFSPCKGWGVIAKPSCKDEGKAKKQRILSLGNQPATTSCVTYYVRKKTH